MAVTIQFFGVAGYKIVTSSGIHVVIDPAPMPKKDRRQFEGALRAALKGESFETVIAGWTQLGLVELQRQRARPALPKPKGKS